MKLFLLIWVLFFVINGNAQTLNPNYDSVLAKKLGADGNGMKHYILVIFKSGENKNTDKKMRDSCFAGHLKNIGILVKQEKLVVAGPFGKNNKDFRGLFILNVPSEEEANLLLQSDPAVKAGYLRAELVPWYGSAALPEYLKASEKISKTIF